VTNPRYLDYLAQAEPRSRKVLPQHRKRLGQRLALCSGLHVEPATEVPAWPMFARPGLSNVMDNPG
jgi:hypothetical protein